MTKRTIEQILADLKNGKRPLLADRPEESDKSRFDCPLCKDQGGYLKTSWEWKYGLSAAAPPNGK